MNRAINVLALLFTLCVSAVADDYIVIVLDTSGSMNQVMSGGKKRMETAQDALIEVLSKVPDSTNVGIVTFRGWIYELGPVDRAQLSEAIRSTRPSGLTPLYTALSTAATELLKKREAQGNIGYYKLLAVTDGAAGDADLNQESSYPDGSPKLGVLQEIIQRGIVVDTIGLDMAGSHSLSKLINGAYMSGDDPQSLTEAVSKAVAEIGFGDGRDTSEDAFEEIGEIPESFAMAATLGLTTYSNQPIGQHAPESIDASRSSNQPTTTTGSNTGLGGIGAVWVWIAILACGILWVLSLLKRLRNDW